MNQVIGIADTGLDTSSCFFADDETYGAITPIDKAGKVEDFRRKVVQYVGFADDRDEKSGHGSHVAGTVAGKSLSVLSNMNGVAPEAKISMYDIGTPILK